MEIKTSIIIFILFLGVEANIYSQPKYNRLSQPLSDFDGCKRKENISLIYHLSNDDYFEKLNPEYFSLLNSEQNFVKKSKIKGKKISFFCERCACSVMFSSFVEKVYYNCNGEVYKVTNIEDSTEILPYQNSQFFIKYSNGKVTSWIHFSKFNGASSILRTTANYQYDKTGELSTYIEKNISSNTCDIFKFEYDNKNNLSNCIYEFKRKDTLVSKQNWNYEMSYDNMGLLLSRSLNFNANPMREFIHTENVIFDNINNVKYTSIMGKFHENEFSYNEISTEKTKSFIETHLSRIGSISHITSEEIYKNNRLTEKHMVSYNWINPTELRKTILYYEYNSKNKLTKVYLEDRLLAEFIYYKNGLIKEEIVYGGFPYHIIYEYDYYY